MGKLISILVFVAFSVIFLLIKFVFIGAKAAYDTVFNPDGEKGKRIAQNTFRIIMERLTELDGTPTEQDMYRILQQSAVDFQRMCRREGYEVPMEQCMFIVGGIFRSIANESHAG